MSPELQHVALLFVLFILPKALQRLRLPSAITSFVIGAVCGLGHFAVNAVFGTSYSTGLFAHDPTVEQLGTLGIVALFLFAGLEIDLDDLRMGATPIATHLVARAALLAIVAFVLHRLLNVPLRPALVIALALLTPSTGFIIDSIHQLPLNQNEKYWIKTKAIASELLALGVLFIVLKSDTPAGFAFSTVALIAMAVIVPWAFKQFAKRVLPYAPKSEFAFLLIMATLCAFATKALGVYYLVGAFIVGIAAQRLRETLPSLSSESLLHAIELFASFFIPFYFFKAGLHLQLADFSLKALLAGSIFVFALLPIRLLAILLQRRIAFSELAQKGLRIGVPMLPTLVFTLVLVGILREQFGGDVPAYYFGGLVIYTITNTLIPGFALRQPATTDFEHPHILPPDPAMAAALESERKKPPEAS